MSEVTERRATGGVFHNRHGEWRIGWMVALLVSVMSAAVFVIVWTVVPIKAHYVARRCHRYGAVTERPVKFARYTFWSWDCLTDNPSQPGTWIPIEQLRGVGD